MAYKTYPVRLFYHYETQPGGSLKAVWHKDKYDAWAAADKYAQSSRTDVTIFEVHFPRTLNAEIAFDMITGKLDPKKYPGKIAEKVYYRKPRPQEQARHEQPVDPYVLLGIDKYSDFTKVDLNVAFKAAAMKFHPDRGGSNAAMQAVNAANDTIKRRMGW